MHIALVTAGGAGMFCGSCMHDNTWARALQTHGADVSLIPTYTPIRVDEENLSAPEVFLGGINVYLDYRFPFWRKLPRGMVHWLDAPWVLNLATKIGVSGNPQKLGGLTLAMLQGESGPHRREVEELAAFLAHLEPDVICFSNALLAGALRELKRRFSGPVYCALQGDDVFLEGLPEPHRSRALELVRERAGAFDGFLTHSRYYRDFMAEYLDLPAERFHLVPLGIDLEGHDGQPVLRDNQHFTVGYFARICEEKGLHRLVDAFAILHERHPGTRLRAGGFLDRRNRKYFREVRRAAEKLGPAFEYVGSPPDHASKVTFFKSLDVLSVPTVYREPKGLYVLEALANGVPVVQPRHGAFEELLETTGGGLLVEPDNAEDLAQALEDLMFDPDRRAALAQAGHQNVRTHYNTRVMAERTLEVFAGSARSNAIQPVVNRKQ